MKIGMAGLGKVEERFAMPMQKLAKNRYLAVINDGVGSLSFMILISSMLMVAAHLISFLVLLSFIPVGFHEVITMISKALMLPFRILLGFMSIYITYEVGFLLADRYKLGAKLGGILSLTALFMFLIPVAISKIEKLASVQVLEDGNSQNVVLLEDLVQWEQWMPFGVSSILLGIVLAIVVVELYRVSVHWKLKEGKFSGIMQAVMPTLMDPIPIILVLIVMIVVSQIPLYSLSVVAGEWLLNVLFNNPFTAVLITFFMNLFWLVGLHGDALMGPWIYAGWFGSLVSNAQEVANGLAPSHPMSSLLWEWFINIGGTGGTLGLALLLFTAKSQQLRGVAKAGILPSLFNINEAIIFGIPLVLNPYFIIPFILGPVLVTITTYIMIMQGWITAPFLVVPWTLPSPLGALLSTMDVRALGMNICNIVILTVIYLPFFKAYDRRLCQDEV